MFQLIAQRLRTLQNRIEEKKISGILLSDSCSVQFFCGFKSSNALLLVLSNTIFLFTDARYLESAKTMFQETSLQVQDLFKSGEWKLFFHEHGVSTLGVEYSNISVARFSAWKKYFGVHFRNIDREIEQIRAEKSVEEIANTKRAAHIADVALREAFSELRPGISEQEFAWKLEQSCREHGAEKLSFDSIVAFGEHSAVPHHHPTERRLKENEAILIDWGVVKNGLCSDCSRSFFWGTPSDAWQRDYEKVFHAQQAGIEEIFPGKKLQCPQEKAEEILGETIPHSFGHGVGLEVHEYPALSTRSRGKFSENMIVTAEPGVYRSGAYGIRIEDLLVVQKDGAHSLTHFPKDLSSAILPKSGISSQKMRQ